MSNLSFKKGLEANLPSQLDNGTFYVVEDTKKVIIDGITLQDGDNLMASLEESMEAYTPVVDFNEEHEARVAREEEIADEVAYLKEEVEKSEKVVAAALTDLHNTKQDELIDGVNIKTINGESILGSGDITIDLDLFLVVSELPTENINPNKIYLVQNENSETGNEYIEYMYVESSQQWEEVGKYTTAIDLTPYALSADVETSINSLNDSVNTVETTLTNKLNAEISARQKDVEDINKAIEENELVTITALTDLEERKLDKMDLPNFDGYATEEWVEEQIANINVGGGGDVNLEGYATEQWVEDKGYVTDAYTKAEVNQKFYQLENGDLRDLHDEIVEVRDDISDLNTNKQDKLVSGTNVKTINGESILGSGDITIDLDLFLVVSELPTTDINPNKIYLIHNADSEAGNEYIEYVYMESTQKWEEIGKYKADIDLADYATKTWVNDEYLPLSGGTIEATDTRALTINRTNGSNSLIHFKGIANGETADLGYLGFGGIDSPIFYSAAGNTHNLIHAGNVGEYALPLSGGTLTGDITAPKFTGNLVGNVTGTASGNLPLSGGTISGNLDINSQTDTTIRYFRMWYYGEGRQNRGLICVNENNVELSYYSPTDAFYQPLTIGRDGFKYNTYDILHSGNYTDYTITKDQFNTLQAEVTENENVAAAAITQLNNLKADKSELPTLASQIRMSQDAPAALRGKTLEEVIIEIYNKLG